VGYILILLKGELKVFKIKHCLCILIDILYTFGMLIQNAINFFDL